LTGYYGLATDAPGASDTRRLEPMNDLNTKMQGMLGHILQNEQGPEQDNARRLLNDWMLKHKIRVENVEFGRGMGNAYKDLYEDEIYRREQMTKLWDEQISKLADEITHFRQHATPEAIQEWDKTRGRFAQFAALAEEKLGADWERKVRKILKITKLTLQKMRDGGAYIKDREFGILRNLSVDDGPDPLVAELQQARAEIESLKRQLANRPTAMPDLDADGEVPLTYHANEIGVMSVAELESFARTAVQNISRADKVALRQWGIQLGRVIMRLEDEFKAARKGKKRVRGDKLGDYLVQATGMALRLLRRWKNAVQCVDSDDWPQVEAWLLVSGYQPKNGADYYHEAKKAWGQGASR
jgi:hypothetical protein